MTYEQAKKTGKVLDGYVKCTFAEIWQKDHNRFFSFNQPHKNQYVVSGIGAYQPPVDETITFMWDLPLFRAVEMPGDQAPAMGWIPVTLTKEAYEYMIARIKQNGKDGYNIKPDAIWYVRPVAVDWMPTDIENVAILDANGTEIDLDAAIKQAETAIEEKKKLLIAAGVATLIV